MPDVQTLSEMPGVIGAFRFSAKGELEDRKISADSELTERVLDLLAHLCVANMAIATMQARGWEAMTGMRGFYPINGFTLVGFTWTVITSEQYGVIMANADVDYEAAYAALAE